MACVAVAAKAAIAADESQHVRRALLKQSRPLGRTFNAGEWVYYWRIANTHTVWFLCVELAIEQLTIN